MGLTMTTRIKSSAVVPAPIEAATYTVAEVAVRYGVSVRHIHRMRDLKQIPGELRIGRAVRFSKAIIDRHLSTAVIPATK